MEAKSCRLCKFRSSDREEWNRHVAIEHGDGHFSTIRCGWCQKKFYDDDHFDSHLSDGVAFCCENQKITGDPLIERIRVAFLSLVDQMMVTPNERNDRSSGASFALVEQSQTTKGQDGRRAGATNSQGSSNRSMTPTLAHRRDVPMIEISDSEDEDKAPDESTIPSPPSNSTQEVSGTATIPKRARVVIIDERTVPILEHDYSRDPIENDETPSENPRTKDAEMDPGRIATHESAHKKTTIDAALMAIAGRNLVNGQLHCHICDSSKKVKGSLTLAKLHTGVFRHALTHAKFKPFACKQCDYKCPRVDVIRLHLKNRHHRASGRDGVDYIDSSEEKADEIVQLFTKCYDRTYTGEAVGED